MIPWSKFEFPENPPDFRVELTIDNLQYYVGETSSQLQRELDSPMLTTAHERWFAMAQLDDPRLDRDFVHPHQVRKLIDLLTMHFDKNPQSSIIRPSSPCAEVLVDHRVSEFETARYAPQLYLEDDLVRSAPSSMHPPNRKTARSAAISIERLLNATPSNIQLPSVAPKDSDDVSLAADSVDEYIEDESQNIARVLANYVRSYRRPNAGARLRKEIRLRSSPINVMKKAEKSQNHNVAIGDIS